MKVIFLSDVRRVGRAREVKEVADGYAVNFLFPNKLAEPATEEKIQRLGDERKALEAAQHKEEEILNNKMDALRGKRVTIAARATPKGGLFKTIVAKDITKAILSEHRLEIPEDAIVIAQPIKTVGEHQVRLEAKNKNAELTLAVVAAQ